MSKYADAYIEAAEILLAKVERIPKITSDKIIILTTSELAKLNSLEGEEPSRHIKLDKKST